jgi:hypothetical protein
MAFQHIVFRYFFACHPGENRDPAVCILVPKLDSGFTSTSLISTLLGSTKLTAGVQAVQSPE